MSEEIRRGEKHSWMQLLSIQAGGALCLPVIMLGQLICQKQGWCAALLIIGCGNLFLLLMGLAFASLSHRRPQSTVEHAIYYFGSKGRLIFTLLMVVTMLCWFAVQTNVMALGLEQIFQRVGFKIFPLALNISLGIALSGALCIGMRMIKYLSNLSGPLLLFTLIYMLVSSQGSLSEATFTLASLGGISLLIGGGIASVIDLPNFFQYARSKRDAYIAVLLLYGVTLPFIEGVGLYLTAVTEGESILEVFQKGRGLLWMLWISLFVLLCGWTTNNANLYSATLATYSLGSKMTFKCRTLALGTLGTLIACFNPLTHLSLLLEILGVTVGSMGAVILTNYLLELLSQRRKSSSYQKSAFVSWLLGVSVGLYALLLDASATGVALFDAFLAAVLAEVSLKFLFRRKNETTEN